MGIGVDIADVARLAAALDRTPALAERLFVDAERGLPVTSLAARFAAKEALAKALGAPPGLRWTDAEVVREDSGRPALRLAVRWRPRRTGWAWRAGTCRSATTAAPRWLWS